MRGSGILFVGVMTLLLGTAIFMSCMILSDINYYSPEDISDNLSECEYIRDKIIETDSCKAVILFEYKDCGSRVYLPSEYYLKHKDNMYCEVLL